MSRCPLLAGTRAELATLPSEVGATGPVEDVFMGLGTSVGMDAEDMAAILEASFPGTRGAAAAELEACFS